MYSDKIYDIIMEIKQSPSRTFKENLLIQSGDLEKELKMVLEYCLNDYKKYYIKKIPEVKGRGNNQFDILTWKLLDVLSGRHLTGHSARNAIFQYLLSLTPKSAELFKLVLNKNLDCGVSVKTVNKMFIGLIPDYQVMKAEEWDPKHFVAGSYVGEKIDGIRATYKNGFFWTRSGRVIKGIGHLCQIAYEGGLTAEWDGELDIPGLDFNTASGLIRSDKTVPNARFTCFDLPLYDGPFHERLNYYYKTLFDMNEPMFRPLGHHKAESIAQVKEIFDMYVSAGSEGVVVKSPHHSYVRKRSHEWLKWKIGDTLDAHVVGFEEGEGKFSGMIGKLIVECMKTHYIHTIGVGKMIQADQLKYFESPENLLGSSVEVKFMEHMPSGDIRHGRFSKFLWDR